MALSVLGLAAKLDAEDRATIVAGEEDAMPMGRGNGPKPPSYNVQTAVDADTGLIVHQSRRKSAIVLKSGLSRRSSHITSTLRRHSRSRRREERTSLK